MLLARPFAYPAQWGDLGGWITGLSTVALALVTLVGLQVQRNEIRRQQGELEAQQEQINEQRQLTQQQTAWITTQLAAQRKAQARRIHADGSSVSAELPGRLFRTLRGGLNRCGVAWTGSRWLAVART